MGNGRFFFEQYSSIAQKWSRVLADIPDLDKEYSLYFDVANSGRLEKFGEFSLIDSIAYNYSYTHEQVFNLSWSEAMTIIAYNRNKAYVNHQAEKLYKDANKK